MSFRSKKVKMNFVDVALKSFLCCFCPVLKTVSSSSDDDDLPDNDKENEKENEKETVKTPVTSPRPAPAEEATATPAEAGW